MESFYMSSIFYIQTDTIHFSARNVKNKSPATKETFIFTTIMSNEGSGYNGETGVFTAPVGGLYMFNLQLCVRTKKYIFVDIVAGDQTIYQGLASDESSAGGSCHSYSISTLLEAKDTVMVKAGNTNGDALFEHSNAWIIFGGFLVHRN